MKTLNITGTSTDICAIPFLETSFCCRTNHLLPFVVYHLFLIIISASIGYPFYAWMLSFLKSLFEIQVNCCLPGFILLLLYAKLPWHSNFLFSHFLVTFEDQISKTTIGFIFFNYLFRGYVAKLDCIWPSKVC